MRFLSSVILLNSEGLMRPLSRDGVNKGRSARKFRGQIGRTKAANMSKGLMRGGWRL